MTLLELFPAFQYALRSNAVFAVQELQSINVQHAAELVSSDKIVAVSFNP